MKLFHEEIELNWKLVNHLNWFQKVILSELILLNCSLLIVHLLPKDSKSSETMIIYLTLFALLFDLALSGPVPKCELPLKLPNVSSNLCLFVL